MVHFRLVYRQSGLREVCRQGWTFPFGKFRNSAYSGKEMTGKLLSNRVRRTYLGGAMAVVVVTDGEGTVNGIQVKRGWGGLSSWMKRRFPPPVPYPPSCASRLCKTHDGVCEEARGHPDGMWIPELCTKKKSCANGLARTKTQPPASTNCAFNSQALSILF